MAQNEMKAKPALPERVRAMEGLGVWDDERCIRAHSSSGDGCNDWLGGDFDATLKNIAGAADNECGGPAGAT